MRESCVTLVCLGALLVLILGGCGTFDAGSVGRPSEARIQADTEAVRTRVRVVSPAKWVKGYSHSPSSISSGGSDVLEIRFRIERPGNVSVLIENAKGEAFRTLNLGERQAGRIRTSWDGLDAEGTAVPPGLYQSIIQLTLPDGTIDAFGEALLGRGAEVLPQKLTVDRRRGVAEFELPQAALVRVITLIENCPALQTNVDWQPLVAGRHSIPINLVKTAGAFDLRDEPRLRVRVDASGIAENQIPVRSNDSGEVPITDVWPGRHSERIVYSRERGLPTPRPEPKFSISFPESSGSDLDVPIVSGIQPVRVTLQGDQVEGMLSGQFEFMFFGDLTFLFEEEEGSNPFTASLDASEFSPGLHHLTVNLLTYDGRVGTETVPFVVP